MVLIQSFCCCILKCAMFLYGEFVVLVIVSWQMSVIILASYRFVTLWISCSLYVTDRIYVKCENKFVKWFLLR